MQVSGDAARACAQCRIGDRFADKVAPGPQPRIGSGRPDLLLTGIYRS